MSEGDSVYKAVFPLQMVCVREGKEEGGGGEERVVGLHLSGPNAGEVLQGFALAIRLVG